MKDGLLYFPYINTPKNEWVLRSILYWDKVGVIMPPDHYYQQNKLSKDTRELIRAELIKPIFPGSYVFGSNEFYNGFTKMIEKNPDIMSRRGMFKHNKFIGIPNDNNQPPRKLIRCYTDLIHIEKMGRVSDYLLKEGLARSDSYPWYEVDGLTSFVFMSYLAGYLGQQPDINLSPGTDNYESLIATPINFKRNEWNNDRESIRAELLENILPVPIGEIDLKEILSFKNEHGQHLTSYRVSIESLVLDLMAIENKDLREEKKENEIKKLNMQKLDIVNRMNKSYWSKVTLSSLLTASSVIVPTAMDLSNKPAVIGAGLALAAASINGIRNHKKIGDSPLVYAAFAEKHFVRNKKKWYFSRKFNNKALTYR